MQKIKQDVTIVVEEFGAQAEVLIPAFELNDLRRERDEYLAQTVSDLYDRVVYMVRSNNLQYDPELDEEDEGPLVTITVSVGACSMSSAFWMDNRRERQNHCKKVVNECFEGALRMQGHLDDVIREEQEKVEAKGEE